MGEHGGLCGCELLLEGGEGGFEAGVVVGEGVVDLDDPVDLVLEAGDGPLGIGQFAQQACVLAAQLVVGLAQGVEGLGPVKQVVAQRVVVRR